MDSIFDLYKKPWKTSQRSDGHWYIEDANGHAIASITVSPSELREEAAKELLYSEDGMMIAAEALRCTEVLDYLDGMPERGCGRRFDDCIAGGDILQNIKGYIIHLENELGICK